MSEAIINFRKFVDLIEGRAMACDGPVTPFLDELNVASDAEKARFNSILAEIYKIPSPSYQDPVCTVAVMGFGGNRWLMPNPINALDAMPIGARLYANPQPAHVASATDPAPAVISRGWQPMETAPRDGKHCILAIYMDGFVYSIQGAFMQGKWMNAADREGEPLAWMPNVLLPEEMCPWTEQYKARAALKSEGSADV